MPFDTADIATGRPGSTGRDRLFLITACVVAVTLAILLRGDRPVAAAVSTTQALQSAGDAEARHAELTAAHAAGTLTDEEFAERLETETLPLWQTAVRLMKQSRADGAVGRRFEEIARSYEQRLAITGTMCAALRTGDEQLLAQSRAAWQKSELDEPVVVPVGNNRPRIGGG